jgi:hypothetical protein
MLNFPGTAEVVTPCRDYFRLCAHVFCMHFMLNTIASLDILVYATLWWMSTVYFEEG